MRNRPLYEVRKIKNIKDMITGSAKLYADRPAFYVKKNGQDYEPVTYRDYMEDVDALGTKLIAMGLKGAKIAVIGENSYEWAVSYMAVVCGTGIVVPLDKELPEEEIENLIRISGIRAIIYTSKNKGVIDNIETEIKISMEEDLNGLIAEGKELIKSGSRDFIDAAIDPSELSILLFTSGTTGSAKGVMLCHDNITLNLMAMSSMLMVYPTDIFLSVLPLHHTYECTCGFLCPLYRGASVAHSEGLRHISKNLKESKATMVLGVPLLFENMYNKIWANAAKNGLDKKLKTAIKINNSLKKIGIDLSKKLFHTIHEALGGNMRILISGAAAIDPNVAKGMRDFGISMVQGYGLTECSPIAALNRDVYYKDEAAGLPLPGVEIKINDQDEDGVGEIIIKGGNVMMGYYEAPDLTANVLKDGWLYTGDLGYIDGDGFIHITGRKKNVIVTKNGKNIFPEELEIYLGRSPYISEALISGRENKDNDLDIIAQIVPNYEAVAEALGENYSDEQLKALIAEEVRKVNKIVQLYKRISDFVIRKEEFIKTTTKKIKRFEEANQLQEENK